MNQNDDISKLIDEWTPEAHGKAYDETSLSEREAINEVTLAKLTFSEKPSSDKRDCPPGGEIMMPILDAYDRHINLETGTAMSPMSLTALRKTDAGSEQKDYFMKGASKSLPFTAREHNEAGVFLARNLACIFKEGYKQQNDINVYINKSKVQGHNRNIIHSMENQLNCSKQIRIAGEEESAQWVIEVDPIETDPEIGVYKLYARTYIRQKGKLITGFTTYAYVDDKKNKT